MKECLNPYSNGICSRSIKQLKEALKDLESLNPYSNGREMATYIIGLLKGVLILILMEYALGARNSLLM